MKRNLPQRPPCEARTITVILHALSTMLLLVSGVSAAAAAESEEGFVPIFNGKDLGDWDGKPGWWYVEDGAITAQSTPQKPCKKCNYLTWRGGKPGDFELRCSFKLVGGNSGIQFRSEQRPDWDTSGYQADMDAGNHWTGALFEHARGGVAMRGEKSVIDEKGKKTSHQSRRSQGTREASQEQRLERISHHRSWKRYHADDQRHGHVASQRPPGRSSGQERNHRVSRCTPALR